LRKFGVRFGAYNIYIPPLLKPAPRVLALQLWALKQSERAVTGLDTIERLAASGRTSIAADKEIDNGLYAVAGYRVCGERAVRVDMLERLADIIRPALAWREGAPGAKPAAAFDGSGSFTVVVGMTSLVGCAGEEFAAILRSLGYRMEKRPKPPAPPPVEATAPALAAPDSGESAPAEMPAEAATETPAEAAVEAAVETTQSAPEAPAEASPAVAEPTPELVSEPPLAPAAEEVAAAEPEMEILTAADAPAPAAGPAEIDELASAQAEPPAAASPEATTAAVVAEEEFVEVWRLGRPDGPRRHRRPQRARTQSHARPENLDATSPQAPAADAVASAPPGEGVPAATDGAEQRQDRRPRRHRHGQGPGRSEESRPDHNRRDQARPDQARPDQGRPEQGRPDRGERRGRADRAERGDRPERDPELRAKYLKGRGENRDRRDKAPDPNSPFAKLAALKEQLEANAKERR
jgi:ATP-dependent RNA helicase SUPV3L1/SUV3